MKKIIISTFIAGLLLVGCTRDDINKDPNSAYTTIPSTLVTYSQKQMSDYVTTPYVYANNFRLMMQYWNEVTYVNESNYDFASKSVSDLIYSSNYVNVLNNLVKARQLINDYVPTATEAPTWPAVKLNQISIIDIMMVYTYQNMVDTFGNVPYSQSNQLGSGTILPAYDDAATIYTDLVARLTADINNLDVGTTSTLGTADLYYSGNVAKWKKFGSSLLLKVGIALADVNPTLAKTAVNNAIAGGLMTSSADNCILNYAATSPNYSPIYDNVATGRNDFVGGKTLVDYMNNNSDPRISKYFKPVGSTGKYIGQVIGAPSPFANFSAPGTFAYTPTTPGILLNYTEVAFYLAEAGARWGIGGDPATNYTNAITSSFLDWGLTASDANTYIAAHPYDATNWKKSIGEQAWVAMYNQAGTSWNFWRRLDYPNLVAPTTAISIADGKVPVRMPYSTREASTNGANVAAASAAIGGDRMTTKIFWDKN